MGEEMTQKPGLLAIWTDVDKAYQADFHQWYDREHLRERVDIPGFRNARRYRTADSPQFFAAYDTESLAVLNSPAYTQALANQTEWSKQVFKGFRNTVRVVAEVMGAAGGGLGGWLLALRCAPLPGRAAGLHVALGEGLAAQLLQTPGVVRTVAAIGRVAGLQVFGTGACDPADATRGLLLVEASDPAALEGLAAGLLSEAALEALGLGPPASRAVYALQYAVMR
jgi:hypothetical protein